MSPAGTWADGELPTGVTLGEDSVVIGTGTFARMRSTRPDAVTIGRGCTMDGVQVALGTEARLRVGDFCYFTNAVLLAELELTFGDYVVVGWNATFADTDFHPLAAAERVRDAIACSPLGAGLPRPEIPRRPVVVGDDVWVGPGATVLKGVRLGDGAWVEPGAVVTTDVAPGDRVLGNPAQVVGRR